MTKRETLGRVQITPTIAEPSMRGRLRRDKKAHALAAPCDKRNARSVKVRVVLRQAELAHLPLPPQSQPPRTPRTKTPRQPMASPSRRNPVAALRYGSLSGHKSHPPHRGRGG